MKTYRGRETDRETDRDTGGSRNKRLELRSKKNAMYLSGRCSKRWLTGWASFWNRIAVDGQLRQIKSKQRTTHHNTFIIPRSYSCNTQASTQQASKSPSSLFLLVSMPAERFVTTVRTTASNSSFEGISASGLCSWLDCHESLSTKGVGASQSSCRQSAGGIDRCPSQAGK